MSTFERRHQSAMVGGRSALVAVLVAVYITPSLHPIGHQMPVAKSGKACQRRSTRLDVSRSRLVLRPGTWPYSLLDFTPQRGPSPGRKTRMHRN